ncbi:MAG: flagellar biosynthesis protein FlhF [Lachnospiraceae bacterium]|nr:flagellar biosynthesis protein FlhF [Lachnospiraceae bacterium]
MIIKKFVGKTEEEALGLAKAELGENVVVMNVRNAKRKGLFKFLKKQQIEVTVALEDENERYAVAAAKQETDMKEAFRQVAQIANVAAETKRTERRAEDKPAEEKTPVSENLTVKASAEEKKGTSVSVEKKLQEADELREKEAVVLEESEGEDGQMIKFMKLLYNTMLDNEVNEKYANQIIHEMQKNTKPHMPFDHALANVYQKMILKFGKAAPIEPAQQNPKVVFFIGPTGVGKTTTIAKIASKFSVEEKKKVALLTADTYRIAAAEQLRTYANILEVPFRVIYSVDEMETALRDFMNFDYILVDTAGHSHQNVTQKENMNSFIHSLDGKVEKEVHLVLSATTKYRDLLSIADTYTDMTSYKIIFTKLDETTTLGNLLNLKLYTGASMSYVTCGQNVPDDIEVFNPQKTVKNLLGGK